MFLYSNRHSPAIPAALLGASQPTIQRAVVRWKNQLRGRSRFIGPLCKSRGHDPQITLQQPLIDQAKESIEVTQASLTFAEADANRYRDLMRTGSGTVQRAQQTEAIRGQTLAQLRRDQAGLVAAQRKVDVLTTERDQAQAQHQRSLAVEQQAAFNLSYTTITAPVEGYVGARTLRVGQFCSGGHAADGRGAARCDVRRRQLQGDPAYFCAREPIRRHPGRWFSEFKAKGPCRQPFARERPGVLVAAA